MRWQLLTALSLGLLLGSILPSGDYLAIGTLLIGLSSLGLVLITRARIGWMGSPSTTSCLEPAAQALADAENVEVCVVGADPAKVPIPKACVREWTLEHEVAELHRFSVGIMPLPKTEWMRGKCALKALHYMACGIPCIATPFGAALDVIEDGVNGLFADTTDEWLDAVNRLRDPSLRDQLGKAARATVEERYSLKGAAPEMRRLLESLQ